MKWKKSLVLLLCVLIGIGTLAGCNSKETNAGKTESTTETDPDKVYPVKSTTTLKYWVRSKAAKSAPNYNDSEFAKALIEQTGINVEFLIPPVGQEQEQFNIMMASGDYPDIVETPYHAAYFPGGGGKAIKEEVLISLNEPLQKWGPNTTKMFEKYPEAERICKSDDGQIYAFPFLRETDEQRIFQGIIVRQDWLDDLNLPKPETIDEWYETLKAFRDQKGATAPLSFHISLLNSTAFIGAYGVTNGFYLEDGKMIYGPTQPGYKEFLKTFRKWYEEGLIDKNILAMDAAQTALDNNILNDKTGATINNAGGGIGKWMAVMEGKDTKFQLAGAKYPVLNKGDRPKFGRMDTAATPYVSITTNCKDVEAAVRLLDYGYSPKGHLLMNWGIEGESYTMDENGQVSYTDAMKNNDKQLTEAEMLAQYACGNGPMIQDKQIMRLNFPRPEQQEAIKLWAETDMLEHFVPGLSPAEEDEEDNVRISHDLTTYNEQMLAKFLTGSEPIDNFDQYVAQLKQLGVDRLQEIYQKAYDKYINR